MKQIKSLVGMSLLVVAAGCAVDEVVDESEQEVVGGTVVSPEATGFVRLFFANTQCTGTLVTNDFVLTAAHCFSPSDVSNPSAILATMGSNQRTGIEAELHPYEDIALLRLDHPLPMNGSTTGFERRLTPFRTTALQPNTMLNCFGFGGQSAGAVIGDGQLRRAQMPVRGVNYSWEGVYFDIALNPNGFGEFLTMGDSGGACLIALPSGEQAIAGITTSLYHRFYEDINGLVDADRIRGWYDGLRVTHEIVSQATQKCVQGVIERTCNGSSNEQFRIVPRGNNTWELRNDLGACLKANGFGFGTCSTSTDSLWLLDAAGGDFYGIRNAWNNQCLEIPSGNPNEGTVLQTSACTGQSNQHWRFDARFPRTLVTSLTPSNLPGSTCLDLASASQALGAPLQMFSCTGNDNQLLRLAQVSGDEHSAQLLHSGQCFDLPFGSMNDGIQVQQWNCVTGAPNQEIHANWHGGAYALRLASSEKCISASGSASNWTPVVQETCGAPGFIQTWYLY